MSAAFPPPALAAPARPAERWGVRLLSFGLWALVAGSAAWWWLASPRPHAAPPAAVVGNPVQTDAPRLARLLGQPDATASAAAAARPLLEGRVTLQGVVAEGDGAGVALLGVDGQPARPFRTGQQVLDDWQLQSVATRSATLGPRNGGSTVAVQMATAASAPAVPAPGGMARPPSLYGGSAGLAAPAGGLPMAPAVPAMPDMSRVAPGAGAAAMAAARQAALPTSAGPASMAARIVPPPQEPPSRPDNN